MNKKGGMVDKELLELILGGAIVIGLTFFFYQLIAPNFDVGDETAKSYFDSFEKQVVVADGGTIGSFSIWSPSDNDDREFSLIYFGDGTRFGGGGREYFSIGENKNHICICSWEESVDNCAFCKNLDLPMIKGSEEGPWAIALGERIEITKKEGYYQILGDGDEEFVGAVSSGSEDDV